MTRKPLCSLAAATCLSLTMASASFGGAHTWRVHELFSNADGTVQFIELRECCGNPGETFLNTLQVTSDANGVIFTFPGNIVGNTAHRRILLGTAGYAALPGVPAPDHIINDSSFNPAGDRVRYYGYDIEFVWTAGQLPTDCVNSRYKDTVTHVQSNGPNSPQNYAGVVGSVTGCTPPTECAGDIAPPGGGGGVGVPDLLAVINSWGPCGGCVADVAPPGGDGTVGVPDLLFIINNWGPCD